MKAIKLFNRKETERSITVYFKLLKKEYNN